MPADIPATMKALVIEERGRVAVKDHPVPAVGDYDVLVKTVAVSQNLTDSHHVNHTIGKPGAVLGCDFSGYVVKVGKNVASPKIGDHVAGFVHGGAFPDSGAYAEYVKTLAELVWVVPPNTLSHEQAAALGCVLWTSVQALYHPARLALVEPPQKAPSDEWILVYGGSSGCGMAAIQLAHLSGYKVVITASPRNFALLKSLGADEAFDYRDPDVMAKIKAVTGDSIAKAYDTIGVKESQRITIEAIRPQGGKVIVLLLPIPEATNRKDVEVSWTLLYTALGRAFNFGPDMYFPASEEDKAHMTGFLKKLPQLIQDGAIKPLPVKVWEGGLEAIPEGMQDLRDGKVSGEKIVNRL